VAQLEITPKAFANFSQGSRSSNPGLANKKMYSTLMKGFASRQTLSGLKRLIDAVPRVLVPRTLGWN
jgi:hypothetical protein